jgi:hypothetical protein
MKQFIKIMKELKNTYEIMKEFKNTYEIMKQNFFKKVITFVSAPSQRRQWQHQQISVR